MNAETKRWESYVDDAGRRHGRWPAVPQMSAWTGNVQQPTARETPREQRLDLLLSLRVRSR
jgi:hypothetical protein